MDWTDVDRALGMAQGSLQRASITHPTADQLRPRSSAAP
jgi:hypothetical protein